MPKTDLTSLNDDIVPSYLLEKTYDSGVNLNKDDFIIPKIKILQGLSPELSIDGARPGVFWHTGAEVSLGKDFTFIIAVLSKKVCLWEPTPSGTGGALLAYSKDGRSWATGGGRQFTVTPRGSKETVTWQTGSNVVSSGLLDWGSSDPSEDRSPPAATLVYDLCLYIPSHPELSPCVLSMYKTSIAAAKRLNTQLLMKANEKPSKPVQSLQVTAKVVEQSNKQGLKWFSPSFNLAGFVKDKSTFDTVMDLSAKYAAHIENYVDTDAKKDVDLDDKIVY